jgi:hypothetical protein
MTNFFAALRVPMRPWLDPEPLKEAYVRLSEALHQQPDSQDELVVLNRAFQVLSNPAARIEHLLSLTGEEASTRQITPAVAELFGRVANRLQAADRFLGEASAQTPALLRALQAQRMQAVQAGLDELARELASYQARCLDELQGLDRCWDHDSANRRDALAQLSLDLIFLQKWQAQVRERLLRMDEATS